jgi:hypothetical protein
LGVCGGDVTRRDPRNTNGDERLESLDGSNFRWWDTYFNYKFAAAGRTVVVVNAILPTI